MQLRLSWQSVNQIRQDNCIPETLKFQLDPETGAVHQLSLHSVCNPVRDCFRLSDEYGFHYRRIILSSLAVYLYYGQTKNLNNRLGSIDCET